MRATDILTSWSSDTDVMEFLKDDEIQFEEMTVSEAKKYVDVSGEFGDSCSILLNVSDSVDGNRTRISRLNMEEDIENVKICIAKHGGGVKVNVFGSDIRIFIGRFGYAFNTDINIWSNSRTIIGDEATCNYARITLNNSNVHIGYDCMISDDVFLQSSDQHGIVDLDSMKIVNDRQSNILVGRHVWIGRRAMILPDCSIGDGAIVGAGAIVTANVEKCAICAGVPARVVKRNMSWSRDPSAISPDEMAMLPSFLDDRLATDGNLP